MPISRPDRGEVQVRRFGSLREADAADREYWAALPDAERILEVWRLSEEQWRLSGQHESGLSRSLTRVYRR
jgi:hypothetical protein